MIEAVTFDYWQTLVEEPRGTMRAMQLDCWQAVLAAAGHEVPRAALDEAFEGSWAVFEERWRENLGPYLPSDATDLICERLGIRSLDGLRAEPWMPSASPGRLRPSISRAVPRIVWRGYGRPASVSASCATSA